jgi:hypothetical protein
VNDHDSGIRSQLISTQTARDIPWPSTLQKLLDIL